MASLGDAPFPTTTAWHGAVRTLLERSIARHGGWARWREAGGVSLVPVSIGGALPRMKGLGRTFPVPTRIELWPREAVAIFRDYPAVGYVGAFASGAVELASADGPAAARATDPRRSFEGWAKYRRWSPLDALYFFGYALTHYQGLPFTLVDAQPVRLRAARVEGRRVQGVEVEIPPHVHTHSRRQTFYFDDDGLLCRHDYVAEVVGRWARGAHLWEDIGAVHGLPVARRRRVYARLGSLATPVVVLDARFSDVSALRTGPDAAWPGTLPSGSP